MAFHDELLAGTTGARAALTRIPVVQDCLQGTVALSGYLAFLQEAYHHVSHTVPLLRACRDRMPQRLDWLRAALDEYIEEEDGHDGWILADIRAAGGDPQAARQAGPGPATEVMVAYAYDTIARGNPVGFFGMVHVLEGTSVALALAAADQIQARLGLPDAALTYLRSHGTLDREHTAHFAGLMDMLDEARDRQAVLHRAGMFYRLYGDVLRSLPRAGTDRSAS